MEPEKNTPKTQAAVTSGGAINYAAKGNVLTVIPASTNACRLREPTGAAYCPVTNTILVADNGNNRIMRFDMDGSNGRDFVRCVDSRCGTYKPVDIAVSPSGRVFVTDDLKCRVLVFTSDGNYVTNIGSCGRDDGQFDDVSGIACHNGCVLVCDYGRVIMFTEDGGFIRHIVIGGHTDYVAVGPDDKIYVTKCKFPDRSSYRSNVCVYRWDGTFVRRIPVHGAIGYRPCGVTVDHEGYVCVAWHHWRRAGGDCVNVYNLQGELHTKFGKRGDGHDQLYIPRGLLLLPDGRLMVCDSGNNHLKIF